MSQCCRNWWMGRSWKHLLMICGCSPRKCLCYFIYWSRWRQHPWSYVSWLNICCPCQKRHLLVSHWPQKKKQYRLIVWVATFLHCQMCPVDSCYTQDQYREKPRVQVTLHILPSLLISRHILPFQDRYKEKPECKSRSTSHPSLFPGKFCLFCQHSMLTKIDTLYYFILYIDSNLLNHGKR